MLSSESEVIEARTRRDTEEFILFPFDLYRNDPLYSPELLRDQRSYFSPQNPFFNHADVKLFIAGDRGKTVGRVVSVVNYLHNERYGDKTGFFGFFESIRDSRTASLLMDRVADELRKAGMNRMRGPMDFSTNEQCGFLIEGFDYPPMIMTPYNPDYYPRLVEEYGMVKSKDLLAFIKEIPEGLPDKIERVARLAERRNITTRKVSKKNLLKDMQVFQEIYNESWSENWGFIPLQDDELTFLAGRLKDVMVPDLTLIAEKDGIPVGFLGLLPDYNGLLRKMMGRLNPLTIFKAFMGYRKIKDLRLLLLGIRPPYRNMGVDAVLLSKAFRYIKGRYERAEFSWILEDNVAVIRLVEMVGGRVYKRYRIYEKEL
ncbi:hypothetical protein BMS3Bbin06_01350 [bacterium BMS3Bbin06]|nr:hypothetical protein BMS3Abin08_00504 [bacterium BMS3Abin08]GBE34819.1 hypothetical protein BMS3Bbin06_01350 [bacterium BMS3Bbin06]